MHNGRYDRPASLIHAVYVAIPRACAAVLELAQTGGDPFRQSSSAIQGKVGWLEGVEQKPGIDMGRMECPDHGISHLSSVSLATSG